MRSVNEEISPSQSPEKRTHIQEAVGPHQSVSTGRSPKADSGLAPRYHVQRNQWSCLAEQELAAAWLCRSFHPYARMRSVLMMRIGTPSSSAGTAPCMRPVSTYTVITAESRSSAPIPTAITAGSAINSDSCAPFTASTRSMSTRDGPPCVADVTPAAAGQDTFVVRVELPTKLTCLPKLELTCESTWPMGLPTVVVLLPANNKAVGCAALLLTIKDPESPAALKLLLATTT